MGEFDVTASDGITVKASGKAVQAGAASRTEKPEIKADTAISQQPNLHLSALAQKMTVGKTLEERKAYLTQEIAKPALPRREKDVIVKVLDACRKDGQLAELVAQMHKQPGPMGATPLQQLYRKMGTSSANTNPLIIAISFGSQVIEDWQSDKRQDMINVLKAGHIDPQIIASVQAH